MKRRHFFQNSKSYQPFSFFFHRVRRFFFKLLYIFLKALHFLMGPVVSKCHYQQVNGVLCLLWVFFEGFKAMRLLSTCIIRSWRKTTVLDISAMDSSAYFNWTARAHWAGLWNTKAWLFQEIEVNNLSMPRIL